MKSYKKPSWPTTTIKVNASKQGETLEQKIERMMNNKEPIKDGSPLIYTDRKDGVQPAYDPRTNKWEIAAEASTKISKSFQAKRNERHNRKDNKEGKEKDQTPNPNAPVDKEGAKIAGNKGGEPIQGK